MTNKQPVLYILAGAIGSGKSTLTKSAFFGTVKIIDPDAIARKLFPDNPESNAATAGRMAIMERRKALAKNKI